MKWCGEVMLIVFDIWGPVDVAHEFEWVTQRGFANSDLMRVDLSAECCVYETLMEHIK